MTDAVDAPHFGPPGVSSSLSQPSAPVRVLAVLLNIVTLMVIQYCLLKRWPSLKSWRTLPTTTWLMIFLYIDSLLFTSSQMVVRYAFGVNGSFTACSTAVFFCLGFYLSSKLLIYFYFVERSFMVWSSRTTGSSAKRTQNKLWLFNMTVIIGGYIVVIVMTFVWRLAYISQAGFCIIGLRRIVSIPLTTYELAINLYLTSLFLLPLRNITHFENRTGTANSRLRKMTKRCLIGAGITCLSTGANLTAVSVFEGEQAWLCLLACNLDLVICVSTLHWVTSFGEQESNVAHKYPVSPQSPDHDPSPQSNGSHKRASHIIDEGVFKDSLVTTSITGGSPRSPPRSNGITIQMAQTQQVENAILEEPRKSIGLGRSTSDAGWRSRSSISGSQGVARPCTIHLHRGKMSLDPNQGREVGLELHVTQDNSLQEVRKKVDDIV